MTRARFLHTADLHLDSPLRSVALRDPDLAASLRGASRKALRRIVDAALAERVDAVLIAGDIFDSGVRDVATLAALSAEARRLNEASIPLICIRGNHDALFDLERQSIAPNLYLFGPAGGYRDVGAMRLHGVSFALRHAPASLLPQYSAPAPGRINVGLMHTSLGGSPGHDPYAPCSLEDLTRHGFDYWGLGHIHQRSVHRQNGVTVVMPGIPQGRHIGEHGRGSATLVQIDDTRTTLLDLPIADLRFDHAVVDADGVSDWADLQGRFETAMAAVGASDHSVVLRLELAGATPLAWELRRDPDRVHEAARAAAEALSGVHVESVKTRVEAPGEADRSAAVAGGMAARTLADMMQAETTAGSYLKEAEEALTALVQALPADLRNALLPADPAERAATLQALIDEGLDITTAHLRSGAS